MTAGERKLDVPRLHRRLPRSGTARRSRTSTPLAKSTFPRDEDFLIDRLEALQARLVSSAFSEEANGAALNITDRSRFFRTF